MYYNRVLAKSNRIDGFFNVGGGNAIPNETIVGAKFSNDKSKHIITHYISKEVLDKTIEHTKKVITIFKDYFTSAPMTSMVFSDSSKFNQIDYSKYGLSKSKFKKYLRDSCFVKGFG
ncbi:serine protease, partial [Streptococcus mitis]|nr:serine protease [Streptococcus mitis]